jgi:hypothetical protein
MHHRKRQGNISRLLHDDEHTIAIYERYTQWVKVCILQEEKQYFVRIKKHFSAHQRPCQCKWSVLVLLNSGVPLFLAVHHPALRLPKSPFPLNLVITPFCPRPLPPTPVQERGVSKGSKMVCVPIFSAPCRAHKKKRGGISPSPMEYVLLRVPCEWGTARRSSRRMIR